MASIRSIKIGSFHQKVNSRVVLEEFSKIVYESDENNNENYGITKVTEMTVYYDIVYITQGSHGSSPLFQGVAYKFQAKNFGVHLRILEGT